MSSCHIFIISELDKIKETRFRFRLSGIGIFPDAHKLRIIWVGAKPITAITNLQKEIIASINDYAKPEQKFHPHITLSRIKAIKNKKEFLESVNPLKLKEISVDASSFTLYKSELCRNWPKYTLKYTLIKKWMLGRPEKQLNSAN